MNRQSMLTGLLVFGLSIAAQAKKAESGKYQIDPMHSKVGFEIAHLVISTVEGSFKNFSGDVEIGDDFSKSKVNASVAVASIDTGVKDRDEHLKSADFFDAQKHGEMIFKSKKITGKPENFKMEGDLTIRGVTKMVVFEGRYLGAVTDGYGNRKIAVAAKSKINRKDFGLTWSKAVEVGPVVGDEVTLELNIQAAKAK